MAVTTMNSTAQVPSTSDQTTNGSMSRTSEAPGVFAGRAHGSPDRSLPGLTAYSYEASYLKRPGPLQEYCLGWLLRDFEDAPLQFINFK